MKCPHFQLCTAEARPISKLQVNTILLTPQNHATGAIQPADEFIAQFLVSWNDHL